MKMSSSSVVGCRVESEGHYGTIKYEGEVPPTKGSWYGMDWDDPSRGKHDGSHKGTRYFTASHSTSGSFLRPQKANLGVDFLTALRDRYGRIDDVDAGVVTEELFVLGKNKQHTVVEMVGAHSVNLKQSQLCQLKEVALRETFIRSAGDSNQISDTIPSVTEIDISKSLLSNWEEVAKIVGKLQHIKILNASENRLELVRDAASIKPFFQKVRTLYLNRMNSDWLQLSRCLEYFTAVQELHVCFNKITEITQLIPNLSNLTLLNLESNPIGSWQAVLSLGQLQNLESLIANFTGITSVEFDETASGSKTHLFPSLKTLSISHNKIDKWKTVDELNKLARLTELSFKFNPLTETASPETIRSIILAKLDNLEFLNRSLMTSGDRKGAEIDYLKAYGKAWRASGGDQDASNNNPSAEFLNEHPRYQTLIDKYGPPEDSELKEHSSALKNSLIVVTIDCPEKPEKKPLQKKLPVTMPIQKLKMMLQRLFKVEAYSMKLTYTSHKHTKGPEIELDNDMKEIGYYSVEDGDTVHIK